MGLPFPFFFFPAYCEAGAWYSGNGAAEVRMCGATGLRAAARRPAGTRRRGRGRQVGNAAARSGRMRAGRRGREVRAAIADALRIACRENAGREVCGLPAAGAQAVRYPVPECAGEQPLAAHGRRARPFRSASGICRCRPAGRRRFRPETEPGLRKTLDENPQKG